MEKGILKGGESGLGVWGGAARGEEGDWQPPTGPLMNGVRETHNYAKSQRVKQAYTFIHTHSWVHAQDHSHTHINMYIHRYRRNMNIHTLVNKILYIHI